MGQHWFFRIREVADAKVGAWVDPEALLPCLEIQSWECKLWLPLGTASMKQLGLLSPRLERMLGSRREKQPLRLWEGSRQRKEIAFLIVHKPPPGLFIRMVADEVDQEVFDNFMAFYLAGLWLDLSKLSLRWKTNLTGLPDFSFMKRIRCVEDLKDRLKVLAAEWYIMMSSNENEKN